MKEIRILAEHGVVLWNCSLTQHQIHTIEKIQKIALKITLGENYVSYENARNQFGLKLLSERRLDLCTKFALKLFKSKYCSTFFTLTSSEVTTRHRKLVVESNCNTARAYKAPHNYLARLVNQNSEKLIKK